MKPDSRLIAVGDPAQAIYGFRGADSNSIDMIVSEFGCTRLPLTVSYRCPKNVVQHARKWVGHIEAAPNAIDGSVIHLDKWDNKVFGPTDLVLCRTTAPIIKLAYSMLKDHIGVRIMGREIGEGLKSLVKKMNAHGITKLVEKLEVYTTREVEKAIAKRQDEKAGSIRDKSDCIMSLINGMPETARTIPALFDIIDRLFSDKANVTLLSTIHKAKGLEAKKVYWLNSSKVIKWAKQEWQLKQENNLRYVATTRAMHELVLIEHAE